MSGSGSREDHVLDDELASAEVRAAHPAAVLREELDIELGPLVVGHHLLSANQSVSGRNTENLSESSLSQIPFFSGCALLFARAFLINLCADF